MKSRHKRRCYYCGAQSTSMEHVPPKQMFRGFDCDSITVPSCDSHNSSKSGIDHAVASAFLISLRNDAGRYNLSPNVRKAINIAERGFERTKRKALSVPLVENPPDSIVDINERGYLVPRTDIGMWVRQVTAALVYDCVNEFDSSIAWNEAAVWSPHWIEAETPTSLPLWRVRSILNRQKSIEKQFFHSIIWRVGWSASPRPYPATIYRFRVHIQSNEVVFQHTFYDSYRWYTCFFASGGTTNQLFRRTRALSVFLM